MTIQWERPLLGGILIGAGVALLVLRTGQTAGISGIFGQSLRGAWGERGWRLLFLAGLLVPALVLGIGPVHPAGGLGSLAVAGLLVGAGTCLGNGCTSGHGVCGLARGSTRSLVATGVFMVTAMLTVWLARHGVTL
jgi:uncharacterized membrane protein YedE/YeeE